MADKLYFSRDTKLYVELTSNLGKFQGLWEVPVLDGFSFSQATNQTEIGLNEMESTVGISRRGRRLFTDSLAPAEFSFSTYIRPTLKGSNHHLVDEVLWAAMAGADVHHSSQSDGSAIHTVESVDYFRNSGDNAESTPVFDVSTGALNFKESNRSTLPKITLYFVFETDATEPMVYKLSNAIVNECSIDFDIDGIATANWSGFAKEVTDMKSGGQVTVQSGTSISGATVGDVFLDNSNDLLLGVATAAGTLQSAYTTGVTSTANFIRNRLTQLEVRGQNPDVMEGKPVAISAISNASAAVLTVASGHGVVAGDTISIVGVVDDNNSTNNTLQAALNGKNHTVNSVTTTSITIATSTASLDAYASGGTVNTGIYSFTLTGGNLTISNNVTYLVPEEIGTINKPIEGVTGARGIGGSFTCYLVFDDTGADGANTGSSADFFADLVNPTKGLTKVVNDFDVTFKVGGTTASTPRVNFNFPQVHIDVPSHNIEDVISLETNFGAYTNDFDTVDEFTMTVFGVSA